MEGKLISHIATEFGVRPGTLRYYETLCLLPTPRRSAGGYRLYDGESQRRLVFIANAKSLGLTLREIREILTAGRSGLLPCESVRSMLSDHVRHIDQQMARLQALKSDLRTILRSYRKRPGGAATRLAVCPMIETLHRGQCTLANGGGAR
jgi:DNA-binding transcriptional MerR regulator